MSAALDTLMLATGGVPVRALFIGAEPHPALAGWPDLTGWQPLKPLAAGWDRAGLRRAEDLPDGKWPLVMVLPGKSRDEALAWFAMARDRLAPGGTLRVAMPNTAGAARFEKELGKATNSIDSLQKHKCRAFHAIENGAWNEEIFTEWRALGDRRDVSGFTVEAGIFSSDHIDPGSQLLADHLPAHLHGHVADLGAGWGFLSDAVLKRCPKIARLDLYEADARALDCARRNLSGNPQEIRFHWHDVTTGLPEVYDAIVMNPPFHTGSTVHAGIALALFTEAARVLRPGGELWTVYNSHLQYRPALTRVVGETRQAGRNDKFTVTVSTRR